MTKITKSNVREFNLVRARNCPTITRPIVVFFLNCSDADNPDDSEAVYVRMRRYLRDRNIEFDVSRTQLDLNASDRLGSGQFGSVCRATYRIDGEPPVTVAVKTLKNTVYRNTSKQAREDPCLLYTSPSPRD